MSLITESPWLLIVLCSSLGIFFLFRWSLTHRGVFMGLGVGLFALAVGSYYLEQSIVTEAEIIEANVHEMAAAVVDNDLPRVMKFFSPRAEKIRAKIGAAMATYSIRDDMRITDMQVEVKAEETLATSHFRANATIVGRASSVGGRGSTRWLLTWQKQAGEWKITEVVRLHPIRDDETLDMMDRAD